MSEVHETIEERIAKDVGVKKPETIPEVKPTPEISEEERKRRLLEEKRRKVFSELMQKLNSMLFDIYEMSIVLAIIENPSKADKDLIEELIKYARRVVAKYREFRNFAQKVREEGLV